MASRSRSAVLPKVLQSIILLCAISRTTALPLPFPQDVSTDNTANSNTTSSMVFYEDSLGVGSHIPGSCGFQGNPDVYGLGIRIGIYTQWLSTMVSNWLVTDSVSQSVNTCFQLVMLIAIIAMSIQDPKPHAIDVYLIVAQIVGSLCTTSSHNIKNTARERKGSKTPTDWGSVTRFFIYWSISAYSTFFWFRGYAYMQPLEPGCEPIAWLFVQVPFFGWYQTLLEIVSSIAFGSFCLLFVYFLYTRGGQMVEDSFIGMWRRKRAKKLAIARGERQRTRTRTLTRIGAPEKPGVATRVTGGLGENSRRNTDTTNSSSSSSSSEEEYVIHVWTPLCCVILFICAVAAIESMIVWNQILGVEEVFSTGQLIPLVTGVGGLLSELYQIWDKPKVWSRLLENYKYAKETAAMVLDHHEHGDESREEDATATAEAKGESSAAGSRNDPAAGSAEGPNANSSKELESKDEVKKEGEAKKEDEVKREYSPTDQEKGASSSTEDAKKSQPTDATQ